MTHDAESLLKSVEEILSDRETYPEGKYLADFIETAVTFVKDRPERGDLRMLRQAFKELRYAFRVFAPYRRVRKVSVFGSARTPEGAKEYEDAHAFATMMTRLGWMVITGAGPGIMQAAQGGAGRSRSFGVNIRLPFEQRANPVIHDDPKLVTFKYFFTRKVVFVKETDAIALFPGGFGTHDEAFESMTLVQTGKTEPLPIVCVESEGGSYWQEWREYVERHLLGGGYISPEDLDLVELAHGVDEATAKIERFYRIYHSARFVRGKLVLRLQAPVADDVLDRINTEFVDILAEGRFERAECDPLEARDEPETAGLARLRFAFNRRSCGRLRQLVNLLNESAGRAAAATREVGG